MKVLDEITEAIQAATGCSDLTAEWVVVGFMRAVAVALGTASVVLFLSALMPRS